MIFSEFKYTAIGPRSENQDSLEIKIVNDFIAACIGDGVGGQQCGKLASSMSVERFISSVTSFDVNFQDIINNIQEEIIQYQANNNKCIGMATTLTGCVIKNNKLIGVHLGDTRLCLLRRNGIKQLTESHTEANRLYRAGKLTKDAYLNYPRRNIIESAIGSKSLSQIQTFEFLLEPGDRILMTTDGIHDLISKSEFRDLSISSPTVQEFGEKAIDLLNLKKLTDNATFLVIENGVRYDYFSQQ